MLSSDQNLTINAAAARSAVEMVEIPFTGELVVDENKTWTRIPGPTGPWYVGPPSDEIDKAWADLIARMKKFVSD